MEQKIVLRIDEKDLGDIFLHFIDIDGVTAEIPTLDLRLPSEENTHPSYSISFPELAAIILGITSTTVSISTLAMSILNAMKSSDERKRPHIQINGNIFFISENTQFENLKQFLEVELNRTQDNIAQQQNIEQFRTIVSGFTFSPKDIDTLKRRRLQELEKQAALFGAHCPPNSGRNLRTS